MIEDKQASNAWKVLFLLFLANLFNFFDRTVPAIVFEPIRHEWSLSDLQLGIISAAFTVVYAVAGIPLGRMADTGSRKTIMGWGLIVWSLLTAAGAGAWNFTSFLITRVLVGVGEASYAPSSSSMIGDLFPAEKRSRAMGVFMLGLPVGLMLAFFTVGSMVSHFGSWRAPFIIAMIPGLLIGIAMFFIREPARGAAEKVKVAEAPIANPIRKILAIPTIWWIVFSGLALNFASYNVNAFIVPLLIRYFHLSLQQASVSAGIIVGVTGLIGLVGGGWLADRAHRGSERGRLMLSGIGLAIGAVATWVAVKLEVSQVGLFIAIYAVAWLLQYLYFTCVYPAIQDVVEPRLRGLTMAVYFAAQYLLGAAWGPVVLGYLSDTYAHAAMVAAGASTLSEAHRAIGLHDAFILVPIAMAVTAFAIFMAMRTFPADAQRMTESMKAG